MLESTTNEKIERITGRNPSTCSCSSCRSQCQRSPCLGTPEDMLKIILAGHGDRLSLSLWVAGMILGVTDRPIEIIAPTYDIKKSSCTFFNDGLCELHDKGLKPTEGKLSHHSITLENVIPEKSLSWNVAKEWINLEVSDLKIMFEKIYEETV